MHAYVSLSVSGTQCGSGIYIPVYISQKKKRCYFDTKMCQSDVSSFDTPTHIIMDKNSSSKLLIVLRIDSCMKMVDLYFIYSPLPSSPLIVLLLKLVVPLKLTVQLLPVAIAPPPSSAELLI